MAVCCTCYSRRLAHYLNDFLHSIDCILFQACNKTVDFTLVHFTPHLTFSGLCESNKTSHEWRVYVLRGGIVKEMKREEANVLVCNIVYHGK